ncbi:MULTISPECIES: metal ABC transporter permease [unclassified Yoonia]|uniref:metal ABC transporter permease n=1 Tax=unclassified Yoonia TaxID=2629118 RepID=UPI002B00086E|nr:MULTISPECIES: metal ABC transporter permease [unclassified Yoonia]
METLLFPFQFAFMNKAFVIMALLAVPTSLLSCYLVLKGWSLMGDAISHAVLPGIVLAYIAGIPLIIGAFLAGMLCSVSTGFLAGNSRIKQDTAMGVVFSGMFGFGIVLYTKISTAVHLDHILFGNMLGVSATDLWTAGSIAAFVTLILLAKQRDLLLHAFDPIQAQAVGLRVGWLHYGLLALISMTIVATLSAVGIILAIGLLIAPGAIAFLVTKRFEAMLMIAVTVSLVSGFVGVYASFFLDSAPAPTVILVMTMIFIAAFLRKSIRARAVA